MLFLKGKKFISQNNDTGIVPYNYSKKEKKGPSSTAPMAMPKVTIAESGQTPP